MSCGGNGIHWQLEGTSRDQLPQLWLRHSRALLAEGDACFLGAGVGRELARRQHSQRHELVAVAWKAQQRLHRV